MNKITATIIRIMPNTFTSNSPSPYSAKIRQIAPIISGTYVPGDMNPKISPYMPTIIRITAICGSLSSSNKEDRTVFFFTYKEASFVANVLFSSSTLTIIPSTLFKRSFSFSAMRSIIPRSNAVFSLSTSLSVTKRLACVAFLPREAAILSTCPAKKFMVFSSAAFLPSTPISTGIAAPVVVPGDIAAILPDIRIKEPADAAIAPFGVTYVITGTSEFSIASVILSVEATSPPGVSSSINTTSAPISSASCKPSTTSKAVPSVIVPSILST